ncbi:bifunctional folylpolyglutamate synthase/dihydrofolate synthase [Salinithrix halophila]|uniref:tetrahydrofolate synthase n=1 Tax=Salinithrix halophila TaxID=1485204 RepID=A0ABV8JKC6_9BACL
MAEAMGFTIADDVFQWMREGCSQGVRPGLDRMEWMCARLGNPERRLKIIHIAGTNGKGSTAAMTASILRQAGYPTGMFTSPYLQHWGERITMDGDPIPESEFVRWAKVVADLTEERAAAGLDRVTEFEFWTLVALLYFAREAVPWFVVWETGLGGRLDSTNVVLPLVSVITNVGHDHQAFLGESIPEIAAEKAGIIKAGVPVVSAVEDEEALLVIRQRAKEKNCRLYLLNRDFKVESFPEKGAEGEAFTFIGPYRSLEKVSIPLKGAHQVKNGAMALMICEVLRQFYATLLDKETVRQGLEKVFWPGRLETVADSPRILLDGAHNREGALALADALTSYEYDQLHFLTGVMADKERENILAPLLPLVDTVTATQANHPRSLPAVELADTIRSLNPEIAVRIAEKPWEGLAQLREEAGGRDLILVAGTLFLVGEIRHSLRTQKWDKGG